MFYSVYALYSNSLSLSLAGAATTSFARTRTHNHHHGPLVSGSVLARDRVALERVALGQGLAASRRELVGQQTLRHRDRRVDAVEVAMRPRGARAEAPGGRADHEFHPRGAGDGRRLLVQRVRIQGRVAVPQTVGLVRVPGARGVDAALEDTKRRVSLSLVLSRSRGVGCNAVLPLCSSFSLAFKRVNFETAKRLPVLEGGAAEDHKWNRQPRDWQPAP